jgi:ribose transport system permease protein/L-arabinose transport system permease protein
VAAAFWVFLHKSIPGRNLYAIGGNPIVARLSGMNLNRYAWECTCCRVPWRDRRHPPGRRTGSGQPISGSEGLELEAITAAFLGGTAMQGGKGTVVGALLGVASLAF